MKNISERTLKINYHANSIEDLEQIITEDINNSKKIIVTTVCQKCKKEWTREVLLCTPPNILILLECC